jgi:hypothetical protein
MVAITLKIPLYSCSANIALRTLIALALVCVVMLFTEDSNAIFFLLFCVPVFEIITPLLTKYELVSNIVPLGG